MALIFCDSFSSYAAGSGDLLNGQWNINSGAGTSLLQVSTNGGKFGTGAIAMGQSTNAQWLMKQLPGVPNNLNFGFYYSHPKAADSSSSNYSLIAGNTTLNSRYIGLDAFYGRLFFYNGSAAGSLGNTPLGFIKPGNTYWIECRITANSMTVYVDGLQVFTYTGSMTLGSLFGIRTEGFFYSPANAYLSHLVVWDDTGPYMNTFPIGPQRIQLLRPNAPGDSEQWTRNAGPATNWQAVDSATWAGGAGVKTLDTAQTDLHNVTDMAWNPWRINAVQSAVRAADVNSGGSAIKLLTKDNGIVQKSTDIALPITNPVTRYAQFSVNSAGNPWTKADIDALQIGYESVI